MLLFADSELFSYICVERPARDSVLTPECRGLLITLKSASMDNDIVLSYKSIPNNPPCHDAIVHSWNRRAFWHDYRSRCMYMVTVSRHKSLKEEFCRVVPDGVDDSGRMKAHAVLSDFGIVLSRELYNVERMYPQVRIMGSAVMPDHVHFMIFIEKELQIGLGGIVKLYKGNCTKQLRIISSPFAERDIPVFQEGYNDRIVLRRGMLDTFMRYVADNPRRLLLRQLYPQYFRKVCKLRIGERIFDAYGNLDLLYEPMKTPLIISSRYSKEERAFYEREWGETARCGGALVSPFISEGEKNLRNDLIKEGASAIHIVDFPFGERYKPSGKMFELCASGRLLLLSENCIQTTEKAMNRHRAMHMNDAARWLAAISQGAAIIGGKG